MWVVTEDGNKPKVTAPGRESNIETIEPVIEFLRNVMLSDTNILGNIFLTIALGKHHSIEDGHKIHTKVPHADGVIVI